MKLNAGDIKALKASAEHWRRMATGKARKGEAPYGHLCACCRRWRVDHCCGMCPLASVGRGGSGCCAGRYIIAADCHEDGGVDSPEFRAAARKVLAFIKSKIPKGGRK